MTTKFYLKSIALTLITSFLLITACEKLDPKVPVGEKIEGKIPKLNTSTISNITSSTATTGGIISTTGGGSITARGVCWSTTENPTTANNKTTDGTGTGSFVSNITGLTPGATYYVRAYATNIAGTAYGNQVSFTTGVITATLTTTTITNINKTSATSGGNITNTGGASITARGVCWSISENPTTDNNKTEDGSGTGIYTSNITGLVPSTKYYVRAYAISNAGTAYGEQLTFTTSSNWIQKADFGGVARQSAVGFSIGNFGYIGIGFGNSNTLKDFWQYNPTSPVRALRGPS